MYYTYFDTWGLELRYGVHLVFQLRFQNTKENYNSIRTMLLQLHADLYLRNWEYLPYSEQHEHNYHSTRHLTNFSTLATDYNGFKLHFCVWDECFTHSHRNLLISVGPTSILNKNLNYIFYKNHRSINVYKIR